MDGAPGVAESGRLRRPRFDVGACVLATAAVVLVVMLGEVNRLSAAVLDDRARAWPFTELMGPSRVLDHSPDGWLAVASALADGPLRGWLVAYLLLDLVLVLVYAVGLRRFLAARHPGAASQVGWVAVVDVAEDVLALVLAVAAGGLTWPAPLLPWVSGLKWFLVGVLLLTLGRRLFTRGDPSWRRPLARLGRAVYTHRFSVLALLPLVALSILPGPDMLDQLPDVQRRWTDSALGVGHAVAACLGLGLLGVVVLVLGRMRSDFTWWRVHGWSSPDRPRPAPLVWFWLVCAGVIVGVALVLPAATRTAGLSPGRVVVFAGVPAVIGVGSLLLRRVLARAPDCAVSRWVHEHVRRPDGRVLRPEHVRPVQLVGDLLAVLVPVVGGLGLVRSFTAPSALGGDDPSSWALLVLGIGSALLAWPLGQAVLDGLDPEDGAPRTALRRAWGWVSSRLSPGHPATHRQTAVAAALFAGSTAGFLLVGSFPMVLARWLGVIACVVLALTMLTTMVASAVVLLQYGGSPQLFWLPGIRLSVAPVTPLLLATILVAGSVTAASDVHRVRGSAAPAAPVGRATVDEAFAGWLADPAACRTEITAGGRAYTLRPMLLVAAEGGGVRAAYWTAAALDVLSGRLPDGGRTGWAAPATGRAACGAHSALLSGGASGGAVGLAFTRFSGAGAAREQVVGITGSLALGAGAVGLLVRDLVYSATGVPLPAPGAVDAADEGLRPWVDRAGLMERAWEQQAPALARPFLPEDEPATAGAASGHLVLTSTSVTTGCRMLVSQLDLAVPGGQEELAEHAADAGDAADADEDGAGEGGAAPANGACDALDRPAPRSVDLLADYAGPGASGDHCLGALTTATASMLTARFPYVTPSGVIGPCGRWPVQQLVDGGYTENTGLGTLVDLAPRWQALVREHNRAQLQLPEGGRRPELVVPLVVYLDNGAGSDLASPSRNLTSEILVPPVGDSRAGGAQSGTSALLQRVGALVTVDRIGLGEAADPPALREAVEGWRPLPVVVVNQSTFPTVTAPLGWVLSEESMASMDRAMDRQVSNRCDPATTTEVLCARGFGTLGDALAVLDERTVP